MTSSDSSTERVVVFDLDGVLVDSKDMVKRAYAEVGVYMPDYVWGLPWQSWLGDPSAHEAKTAVYLDMITDEGVTELSGVDVARRVRTEGLGRVMVLTGASDESTELVLTSLDLADIDWSTGQTRDGKARMLQGLIQDGHEVVYVDDDEDAVRHFQRTIADLHVVHYQGQDAGDLWEALWTR